MGCSQHHQLCMAGSSQPLTAGPAVPLGRAAERAAVELSALADHFYRAFTDQCGAQTDPCAQADLLLCAQGLHPAKLCHSQGLLVAGQAWLLAAPHTGIQMDLLPCPLLLPPAGRRFRARTPVCIPGHSEALGTAGKGCALLGKAELLHFLQPSLWQEGFALLFLVFSWLASCSFLFPSTSLG